MLPQALPNGYVTGLRIRGLFLLFLIPVQALACARAISSRSHEGLFAAFSHPPTPGYTMIVYFPMAFHGQESRWRVGNTIYEKHFGSNHHFINGATRDDTSFMVKAVYPHNRDTGLRYYEPLFVAGQFESEIATYTSQVRKVLLDRKTITEVEAKEYEEEDAEIPLGRKILFVFVDEFGNAKAILRMLDYSATPYTYGGPSRFVLPDALFSLAHSFLGIHLGVQVSSGLIPESSVAQNLLSFRFERKLKSKCIPERNGRFPVPTYLLGRYLISRGSLQSPEALLRRVAEYLYYKDGFLGSYRLGVIYATATEAGHRTYTKRSSRSPYHYDTIFTPDDFILKPTDTPIYAIRQSVSDFFDRHAGLDEVTYHSYPTADENETESPIVCESHPSLAND